MSPTDVNKTLRNAKIGVGIYVIVLIISNSMQYYDSYNALSSPYGYLAKLADYPPLIKILTFSSAFMGIFGSILVFIGIRIRRPSLFIPYFIELSWEILISTWYFFKHFLAYSAAGLIFCNQYIRLNTILVPLAVDLVIMIYIIGYLGAHVLIFIRPVFRAKKALQSKEDCQVKIPGTELQEVYTVS